MPRQFKKFEVLSQLSPNAVLFVGAAFGVVATFSRMTLGYCRTTTCAQAAPPEECVPGQIIDSCQMAGIPLYWSGTCVSFSVQKDGSKSSGVTADQLQAVLRASFDNWQNVACPTGGKPSISVETYPQVECAEPRYNPSAPNQNVWIFRDDDWPYSGNNLAQTFVSFNSQTGEIYDVDVELNSYAKEFTLTSSSEGTDLLSIVQHEAGHFLGLANSSVYEATMWPVYSGGADGRTLESDDVAGICATYPPAATPPITCNAEPRHGFSTKCQETVDAGTVDAGNVDASAVDAGNVEGRGGVSDGSACTVVAAGSNGTRRGVAVVAALLGLGIASLTRRRCGDGSAAKGKRSIKGLD